MLKILVEVPVTNFPRSYARDYKETHLIPPFSTCYGFLLSAIGELDLDKYRGAAISIGWLGQKPRKSKTIRKRHVWNKNNGKNPYPSKARSSVPLTHCRKVERVELLCNLKIVVGVEHPELEQQLTLAIDRPEQINRFGNLSLGESYALVNTFDWFSGSTDSVTWLSRDPKGRYSLPVWIDRNTGKATFKRFSEGEFCKGSWVKI